MMNKQEFQEKYWSKVKDKQGLIDRIAKKSKTKPNSVRQNWITNFSIPENDKDWFFEMVKEEVKTQKAFEKMKDDFDKSVLDERISELIRRQIASIKGFN